MREYERNGKPVIHSTDIYNYHTYCPFSVKRHQETDFMSDAMWKGLLFEAYAIGFKESERFPAFEEMEIHGTKFNKDGSMPKARIGMLNDMKIEAEKMKSYFEGGTPFDRIEVEFDDYILTGEIDYNKPEVIRDCKRTRNFEYWDEKTDFPTTLELLQAVYYPYLWFIKTKEIKPFEYVVYSYELKLVKVYRAENPQILFKELKQKIDKYVNDIFMSPNLGLHCDEAGFNGCRPKCSEYIKKITEPKSFLFDSLEMESDTEWTEKDIDLLYGSLTN